MKYIFLIFLLPFFLLSCGSKGESLVIPAEEVSVVTADIGYEWAGTEPFWAFRFVNNELLWQEPGDDGTQSYTASGSKTEDTQKKEITLKAGDFTATLIEDAQCTDGMTENSYQYKVLLQKDERTFSGCARKYIE